MQHEFKELYTEAERLLGEIVLGKGLNAGTVASALRSASGRIYSGICLHLCCGIGTCAEHAALLEMLKNGETRVTEIVAISKDGCLSPCGRCRETLAQIDAGNLSTKIMIAGGKVATLSELLPAFWLTAKNE